MVLSDATGRVMRLWGGYSPKLFDGHFLKMNQDWFCRKLSGGVVVADQHFNWGRKHLQDPKFHTPIKKPPKPGKHFKDARTLTKAEVSYNHAIHQARARVETIFGRMNVRFKILTTPWRESNEQLDALVWMALAILNTEIK